MTKKGIAVLQNDGSAAHKLLDDGTAVLGNDSGTCSIKLQGPNIKLDGLNVASATGNTDSIAHAINAIEDDIEAERDTGSVNRINALKNAFDKLALVAHGSGDRENIYAAPTNNGVAIPFVTAANPQSLREADEMLNNELVRQLNELTTLEGSAATAGSIRKRIADIRGALPTAAFDKLEEFATSINEETNFARDMLVEIGKAVDELDGYVKTPVSSSGETYEMDTTLLAVSSSIDGNRILNAYNDTDKGTQYDHKIDIRDMNTEMGFTTDANEAAVLVAPSETDNGVLTTADTAPVARDLAIALGAKELADDIDTLIEAGGEFKATSGEITLTMTAAGVNAQLNGDLTCTGQLQVPMITVTTPYETGNHDGKMFFLNAANDNGRHIDFREGYKFYFCENGQWFPSEMLLE